MTVKPLLYLHCSIEPLYRAVEPQQWLQRHPEASSSWPSWPQASKEGATTCDILAEVLDAVDILEESAVAPHLLLGLFAHNLISRTILEATQGQILSQSPTEATSGR